MSLETNLEAAQQTATPEVYRFTCGSRVDCYTTDTSQVIFNGEIYTPTALERSDFTQGVALNPVPVRITAQVTPLFLSYVANSPLEATRVRVWRVLRSDTTSYLFVFSGVMTGIGFEGNAAAMEFESQGHILKRRMGYVYQAYCNHEVFDSGCGLLASAWRVAGTVASLSGASMVVSACAAYDDDYFTGGYVEAGTDARLITGHTTDTLDMQMAFDDRVVAGTAVNVYPGCSGDPAVCEARYNNIEHFLGFPYIPSHNPAIWGFR